MLHKKTVLIVIGLSFLVASQVQAKPERGERKAPQEAFDACVSMQEGDPVQITSPDSELLNATCMLKNDILVAVPDRHLNKDGKAKKRIPKEAIVACEGKNEGDEVMVLNKENQLMEATCTSTPTRLFAKPNKESVEENS